MEDYKEEMRNIFVQHYDVSGKDHQLLKKTTEAVWHELRGIIPAHPIDEHDVYEMLKSLGFKQDLEIITKQICIVEEDKSKGLKAEYDTVEVGRHFVWLIYQKQ